MASTRRSRPAPKWPTLRKQLDDVHAPAGSPLEELIRANQDTELLHASEIDDGQPYPPWLRVRWRKAHPDEYPPGEPVIYPMMLERVMEWMEHNPDKVSPTLDTGDGNGTDGSGGDAGSSRR